MRHGIIPVSVIVGGKALERLESLRGKISSRKKMKPCIFLKLY